MHISSLYHIITASEQSSCQYFFSYTSARYVCTWPPPILREAVRHAQTKPGTAVRKFIYGRLSPVLSAYGERRGSERTPSASLPA